MLAPAAAAGANAAASTHLRRHSAMETQPTASPACPPPSPPRRQAALQNVSFPEEQRAAMLELGDRAWGATPWVQCM